MFLIVGSICVGLLGSWQVVEGRPSHKLVSASMIEDDQQFESKYIWHNGQPKLGRVWAVLELWTDVHVPLMWDGYMENLNTGVTWHISNIQQITHETSQAFSDQSSYYCWRFVGTDYGYRYHQTSWWINETNTLDICEADVRNDTTGDLFLYEWFDEYSKGMYCCGSMNPLYRLETQVSGVFQ